MDTRHKTGNGRMLRGLLVRLLGSSLLCGFVLRRRQDLHRSAGLFDRLDRGLGRTVDFDVNLRLDFATAEQPDAALGAAQQAGLHQRFRVDNRLGVELLRVDGFLKAVEIDLAQFHAENVVEAALRQPAMQRHLAAFKALDAHARTRGLALAAAACLLALAGANATANPHALLARAGVVGDLGELHRSLPYFSSTTRTRC